MALLMLGYSAAPALSDDGSTPKGFTGFDSAPDWSAEQVDFEGASQVSTFDLSYGATEAAPGFATTAHGQIDWAHRETLDAAAARIRAREGAARGFGFESFDRTAQTGGLGWGLSR